MTLLKLSIVAPLFTFLAACGGGGSNDNSEIVVNDDPDQTTQTTQSGACATAYYSELAGDYEGQIMYGSDTATCNWQTNLTVSTSTYSLGEILIDEICEVQAEYTSTLLSGDLACADVSVTSQLIEPYGANTNVDELNDPDWPIDGSLRFNAELDADQIYPVGKTGRVLYFDLQFDGNGAAYFPPNNDDNFTGTMTRQ